jgi:ABC-2 type transport system permease protein
MRIDIVLNPWSVLGVFALVVLLGMCFSSLSLALAPIFRTRERMMGIGMAITMPLFFASNAIYPVSIMPSWIRPIATVNPLSYVVDGIRALFATGNLSSLPVDMLAVAMATVVLLLLAGISFRRIIS